MSIDVDKFVEVQLKLLQLEHEAEINESRNFIEHVPFKELVQKGVCINKLSISEIKSGLYGRTIIVFESRVHQLSKSKNGESKPVLVTNKITSGDIVTLGIGDKEIINNSGVIISIKNNSINVAFETEVESINDYKDKNNLFLIKTANDVTHRRLKSAIKYLNSSNLRSSEVIDTLFGKTELRYVGSIETSQTFFNNSLNSHQKEAVSFALNQSNKVSIIHGPPGTGKTTTVIEIILQSAISNGLKVLAVAPSNVAVDNLLEKLVSFKSKSKCSQLNFVRLGHPVRAMESLQKFSLDSLVSTSDQKELIRDIQSELDAIKDKSKYQNRSNVKTLYNELHERERKAVKEILTKSNVILSTLTSSSIEGPLKYLMKSKDSDGHLTVNSKLPFDVLIIDECSQAMEASCWIPIPMASKLILAGDHHQLPPTIISKEAAKNGLEITLMERLIKSTATKDKAKLVRMLTTQYRMNEKIMEWSSQQFYENKLIADQSVANHNLTDLVPTKSSEVSLSESLVSKVLVLIDTSGCDMPELDVVDEESKGNEYEAAIVVKYIQSLIDLKIDPSLIGVITPYNLQVQLISSALNAIGLSTSIEVKSVDGFQGREKEIIILSLVRSNEDRDIGFLAESRRINVAVTRAKRQVVLICDSETVSSDDVIKTLIDHFEVNGDVRSAVEFTSSDGCFDTSNDVQHPANLRFKEQKKATKGKEFMEKEMINKKPSMKKPVISKEEQELKDQERKSVFAEQIDEFLNSDEDVLEFPPTLNSFERMLVHQIVENYSNLTHCSVGEGNERRLVVSKVLEAETLEELVLELDQEVQSIEREGEESELVEGLEPKANKNKKKKVKKPVAVNPVNQVPVTKVKVKVNNLIKKDKLKDALENATDDDFDSLIAAAVKSNTTCNFVKCKSSTMTVGQVCRYCSRIFCITHMLAEIHGCGDEVKKISRKTMIREGVIYPGSGVPSKKPNAIRRSHLERSLNKKLEQMNMDRKGGDKAKK